MQPPITTYKCLGVDPLKLHTRLTLPTSVGLRFRVLWQSELVIEILVLLLVTWSAVFLKFLSPVTTRLIGLLGVVRTTMKPTNRTLNRAGTTSNSCCNTHVSTPPSYVRRPGPSAG